VTLFILQTTSPFSSLLVRLQSIVGYAREGALIVGAAVLVLLVGWFLALLLGMVVRAILRLTGFNHAARPLFVEGPLEAHEPAIIASEVVRWLTFIAAAVLAIDLLGYNLSGALAARLQEVTPRVLAAALILVGGSFAAILLGALTRRFFSSAGLRGARLRGQIVTSIFTFFAFVVALEQLGFAAQFVLALGLIVAGAAGLALALAVGLGCRDLARDFVVEYLRDLEDREEP
jgi:hypothetical protein